MRSAGRACDRSLRRGWRSILVLIAKVHAHSPVAARENARALDNPASKLCSWSQRARPAQAQLTPVLPPGEA
jgi:hypothetical protein